MRKEWHRGCSAEDTSGGGRCGRLGCFPPCLQACLRDHKAGIEECRSVHMQSYGVAYARARREMSGWHACSAIVGRPCVPLQEAVYCEATHCCTDTPADPPALLAPRDLCLSRVDNSANIGFSRSARFAPSRSSRSSSRPSPSSSPGSHTTRRTTSCTGCRRCSSRRSHVSSQGG
jgi:hypothetical protein